ncbi:MAG: signal recognition particle-docking protein FtsY [Candidatus Marsarchaeota archaeon]|nr:signal recognition particle-docking protein FtsY [Candidatus Marsarchaeota archaeon]
MFEGLKNKISGVIRGFIKKEEAEIEEEVEEEIKEETAPEEPKKDINEEESGQDAADKEKYIGKTAEKDHEEPTEPQTAETEPAKKIIEAEPEIAGNEKREQKKEVNKEGDKPKTKKEPAEAKGKDQQNYNINLSIKTKIKKVFLSKVRLNDSDINQFLEELRISLLQSDVSYNTVESFTEDLDRKLRSNEFESKEISRQIIEQVRLALTDVLNKNMGSYIDLFETISNKVAKNEVPIKILFIGPNGTGKTTTIAKIANGLKKRNITSILSASDTFRAAAIEQTEYHANKVGVPVIKSRYGADPASVAFDAINYANARSIKVVLIDSAGRQETNKNLIGEISKMARVTKPDITLFVGESISGHVISEQINEFSKFIKIDGIILTKLDCDAKGGNAISIAYDTNAPILFMGTGESYDALVNFSPKFIIDSVLPA